MGSAATWDLIDRERSAMVDQLTALAATDWTKPSLVAGWSVQVVAAHIVNGAEQTTGHFAKRLAANGFRFNTTMDRDARQSGALPPTEIVARLRARTTTTNRPPATVVTMLGEVVVHGEDIRRPLGLEGDTPPEAVAACLELYARANFPVGSKRRIADLHITAPDVGWSHGSGPEVRGPGLSLLMAITGRPTGVLEFEGAGVATFATRMRTGS